MASLSLRISQRPDAVDQITPPSSYDDTAQTPSLNAKVSDNRHTPPSDTGSKADSDKRFTQLPRIIEAFRQHSRGGGLPHKLAYHLAPGEYIEIERQLSDLVHSRISFDYYAPRRRFYFRMHGTKHETFLHAINYNIQRQLCEISQGSDQAATFARDILGSLSTSGKYPGSEGESKHDPDAQFGHKDSWHPSIMIEVADSQAGKKLRDCANSYLLGSGGHVNVVIGFDLAYGPHAGPKTTIMIWTLDIDPQRKIRKVVEQVQPLRDDQGNAVGAGLRLKLSQFAPQWLVFHGHDHDIIISAQRLCEMLSKAEQYASVRKLPPADSFGSDPGWTDVPVPKTPPEEIPEEDEESEGTEWEDEDRKRDPDWEEEEEVEQ